MSLTIIFQTVLPVMPKVAQAKSRLSDWLGHNKIAKFDSQSVYGGCRLQLAQPRFRVWNAILQEGAVSAWWDWLMLHVFNHLWHWEDGVPDRLTGGPIHVVWHGVEAPQVVDHHFLLHQLLGQSLAQQLAEEQDHGHCKEREKKHSWGIFDGLLSPS